MFTVMGFTVATKAQAQSVLLVAALKGDENAKRQILAILPKLPD